MQFLAMLTMAIDHVGKVFFEDQIAWRVIGRIAFPIYAYMIVSGYRHTKDKQKYFYRLLLIALLSQFPYMYGLSATGINVVGSFAICLIVLLGMDKTKLYIFRILLIAAASFILEYFNFDYGMYGLFLILIYRYTTSKEMVLLHIMLNLFFLVYKGWLVQITSIWSTIALLYMPQIIKWIEAFRIPRWLWRSFYPAHLAGISIVLFIETF